MADFVVNTKSADVTWGSITTGAVVGTYVQFPSLTCDEVQITVGSAANGVQIAGSSSPGNAWLFIGPPAAAAPAQLQPGVIKTGGNLSNLWASPNAAAATVIRYQTVRYRPYRT